MLDPKVVPRMVALDSGIMSGMPPKVTAETGLDAIIISELRYRVRLYARSAIRMIFENLRLTYKEP